MPGHAHTHTAAGPPAPGGRLPGEGAARARTKRALKLVLPLTATFTVAEVVAGLLAGSLALLADAAHTLSDNFAIGLALFAVVNVCAPAVQHLRTYEPIPTNGLVAQVSCERTAPRTFRVTLTRLPEGRMQVFELTGDEWRIEARTLVWKGRATQVGLDPAFRWERLTSRHLRVTAPRKSASRPAATVVVPVASVDERLPMPGTVITRQYKGRMLNVKVLRDGFEFEGEAYKSLSAVAKAITGTHWNGYHFFGLRKVGVAR